MKETDEKKDNLIRGLITKVCEKREVPDVRFPLEFYDKHSLLVKKILDRKQDLPSVKFLIDQYKFEPEYDQLTITDTIESLERVYLKEKTVEAVTDLSVKMRRDFDGKPISEELSLFTKKIADMSASLQRSSIIDISNEQARAADDYFDWINNRVQIKTGWPVFDQQIMPELGQLTLLCAPTKRGKTTAMTYSFVESVRAGIPALYVSLEMTHIEMANKVLANFGNGKVSYSDLRSGRVDRETYLKMLDALKKIPAYILTTSTESNITLDVIEKHIIDKKPLIVYVDYIGILKGVDLNWNAATSVSALLKQMAQRTGTHIIAACQSDPNLTKDEFRSPADELTGIIGEPEGTPKIPQFTDVRGLKNLAFDSDAFIGLNSKKSRLDENKMTFFFECSLNRHGGTCEWEMAADFRTGKWTNL